MVGSGIDCRIAEWLVRLDEQPVVVAGEVALEATDGLDACLALGFLPLQIGTCFWIESSACHRNDVQGAVDARPNRPTDFFRRMLGPASRPGVPARPPEDPPKQAPATAGRPLGKGVGKDGLPSQTRDSLIFRPFAGVSGMGPAGLEPATYRL
jgi:hypothetical protein